MLATCGLNGVGVEIDCRLDFTPGGEGDLLGLGLTSRTHLQEHSQLPRVLYKRIEC